MGKTNCAFGQPGLIGSRLPSVKGPNILAVHAQKHPLVIDLDQHHLVLQPHWIDLQDLYLFIQLLCKGRAPLFVEPP